MPRNPETSLVVKFGSKSIGTPSGEPRKELIEQNAADLAYVRNSGLVVIVSSGAELFGGKKVLTPRYREYLRDRKEQIRHEYGSDEEELDRQVKAVNLEVTRDIHRVGQGILMQIWGHAFAKHRLTVLPELLDGKKRDLSESIRLAHQRDAILIFNGHGSLDPDGEAGDNDLNLPGVVDWVAPNIDEEENPEDPETRLFVLGVTDPATRGLLNRDGETIEIYHGSTLHRLDHPDRVISKGGPESKGLAFFGIKEAHPRRSRVGISGNGERVIYDFRFKGTADTLIELRKESNQVDAPEALAS